MKLDYQIQVSVQQALQACFGLSVSPESVMLQPTRKEFAGTHTVVLFSFTKDLGKKPEEIGEEIGRYLVSQSGMVSAYNVVKGFLNLELTDRVWLDVFQTIRQEPNPCQLAPTGEKVMVEFSSPNTNKPLHLGHLRNNFLGDAVSRILKARGHEVMKVNLVNDRGIHICKSMLAYQRFGQGETPESTGLKGDHLVGKYYVRFDQEYKKEIEALIQKGMDPELAKKEATILKDAQLMLQKWEEGDAAIVSLWKTMNGWVYDGFNASYTTMGITFDKFYYESDTYLLGKDVVEEGLSKGVFFKKPDGSVWIDLTVEKMDEKLVLRGDGTSVYITQDMGTCDYKHRDFAFDRSVYVVGNEQDYHFKVLFSIMKKLGRSYSDGLYHLSYGMVDLPSGKMKSREGTVVDADDLMAEMVETAEKQTRELGKIEGLTEAQAQSLHQMLGMGALKYFLLKVDPKKRMLFNPEESIEFQGNTGPFVQYTHARIAAILRRAAALGVSTEFDLAAIAKLESRELAVISKLAGLKPAVELAAAEHAPSVIANYVYELAKEYNGFYQEIQIFGGKDPNLVGFRIALSFTVALAIRSSMELLGIEVPERM